MEFTIKSGSPEKQRSACVVVGVFDNRKPSLSADLIDRASGGYISEIIRRGDMEGKLGAMLLLHNVRGTLPLTIEQIDTMLQLIAAARGDSIDAFLDLGCGDGFLSAAILDEHPRARGVLVDFSAPVIEAA